MPVNNYRDHYGILQITIFKQLMSINIDSGRGYKNWFRQAQLMVAKAIL